MPHRLNEIVGFLVSANLSRRSELASFLLDASGDFRGKLGTTIEEQLRANRDLGGSRPFSTYGELRLTTFIWSEGSPRRADFAVEHTQVVIAANHETSRPLLELEYTPDGALKAVHWQHVTLAALSSTELDRVHAAGVHLRRRRVMSAQKERKIGPNETCPCGSGRKYKRCCRS
jgi:hypothetical protein